MRREIYISHSNSNLLADVVINTLFLKSLFSPASPRAMGNNDIQFADRNNNIVGNSFHNNQQAQLLLR